MGRQVLPTIAALRIDLKPDAFTPRGFVPGDDAARGDRPHRDPRTLRG
jgi:hypothetical protein